MQNIVIVGDSGVGKSSFLLRIANGYFTESYIATLGKEMVHITYNGVTYLIHDTSGNERFHDVCAPYFKHAHGAIVFTDVDRQGSVQKWISTLRANNIDIPVVTVCNKIDKPITRTLTADIAISCKTGENVDKVFEYIVPRLKPVKILHEDWWDLSLLTFCSLQ